jgi:hypothetical protein
LRQLKVCIMLAILGGFSIGVRLRWTRTAMLLRLLLSRLIKAAWLVIL